ncbi:PREDICTED: putative uncharacterized protein ZNRD1-AS1 [Nelumbo nucifera]|uniref:Uncharacterized protein n=1 Tax=Nelumbo nucifera TaxID=4432 RepID=A0A1U8AVE4_NELNU|nr:PREDICTED: putative uncharacterized protein ZNRD1-AS1 [Nelumbo nucifera]
MKQMEAATETILKKNLISRPPPPPPPPPPPRALPRYWIPIRQAENTIQSVTKQEIAKFWRQKRMEEEDHLLAAIKAAARIRARNLTEEDYRRFEESLKDNEVEESLKDKKITKTEDNNNEKKDENIKELRVGIKDWWTKSRYAYLNQPAIESMEPPKRSSTYIPNFFFYKPPSPQPTSLGVF